MTVFLQMKSGAVMSLPHVNKIEHVRGEYSLLFHHDGFGKMQRVPEYDIEIVQIKVEP